MIIAKVFNARPGPCDVETTLVFASFSFENCIVNEHELGVLVSLCLCDVVGSVCNASSGPCSSFKSVYNVLCRRNSRGETEYSDF